MCANIFFETQMLSKRNYKYCFVQQKKKEIVLEKNVEKKFF